VISPLTRVYQPGLSEKEAQLYRPRTLTPQLVFFRKFKLETAKNLVRALEAQKLVAPIHLPYAGLSVPKMNKLSSKPSSTLKQQ